MQSPGPDILSPFIDVRRDESDFLDRVVRKSQMNTFGFEQCSVLANQRVFRLRQNPDKILFSQRAKLDADWKTSLKLGDQIGRFDGVKSPRSDKQNMVGFHHAVLGIHGGAFDDGKQVTLYAF